jgi:hypothetical protein
MQDKLLLRTLRQWYGSRPDIDRNYRDLELLPPPPLVAAAAVTASTTQTTITVPISALASSQEVGRRPSIINDSPTDKAGRESEKSEVIKTTPGNPFA